PRSRTLSPGATRASSQSRRRAKRSGSASGATAAQTASRRSAWDIAGATVPCAPVTRVLAVCAVDRPGGAEVGLLRLLRRRPGWDVTLATPGDGPLRSVARAEGWATARLALGGLERCAGARALASRPRARRLAAAPWGDGGPVVGFVGRLEPRKAPDVLVAAAPAIRAGAPGARVLLIGEDSYAVDPTYARAVAGAAAVEHVGWVDNAPGMMRHLDVLVLPSRSEPFGTVLAEAMAVGTPVVATRVDGLAEVVEDGVTGAL